MATYGKKASQMVERAMDKMKHGTLKSGGSGDKVTDPRQAIAIGLSEARAEGGKVPAKTAPARKAAGKTTPSKKAASKKAASKKSATKKAATKKAATKKAATKKAATKKSATKKTSAGTT